MSNKFPPFSLLRRTRLWVTFKVNIFILGRSLEVTRDFPRSRDKLQWSWHFGPHLKLVTIPSRTRHQLVFLASVCLPQG